MAKGNHDVVIVGGGHNGLVCACYLAKGGLDVLVLERQDVVGGAAITEEFHPGFRNSVASYTVSLLHPKVIDDLHLAARQALALRGEEPGVAAHLQRQEKHEFVNPLPTGTHIMEEADVLVALRGWKNTKKSKCNNNRKFR